MPQCRNGQVDPSPVRQSIQHALSPHTQADGALGAMLQVWSCQVFQFEDSPADGPGALRVTFQEELADQ